MARSLPSALLILVAAPETLADVPRTGTAAHGDWHDDAPGVARHITPGSMPPPFASRSAPLGNAFYSDSQFPPDYRGDAFVTLHGSWNRTLRTGYKVVRLRVSEGRPTGVYEDFLTGFVVSDQAVWGRPVGVAVAHDGALLVSENGNGKLWRVSYHAGNR